jgi:hypothetical protein
MTLDLVQAVALAASLGLPAIASAGGEEPFGLLSVGQVVADLGKPGVHLFDANTEEVYAAGHVPGAKLVSYKVKPSDLPADKGAKLVFYCKNPH